MQFFSLDGFDLQSNVLLAFFTCVSVSSFGSCVNVRMCVCVCCA